MNNPPSPNGFVKLPDPIIQRKDISSSAKLVAGVIARLQRNGAACWPSYATIARMCGISRSQAIRSAAELERIGELKIVSGGTRRPNLFSLAFVTQSALRKARAERRIAGSKTELEASSNLRPS